MTKGRTRVIILKYLVLFKISFMQNSILRHCYFFIFFILHIVKHFVSPSSSSSYKKSPFLCSELITKYRHFVLHLEKVQMSFKNEVRERVKER